MTTMSTLSLRQRLSEYEKLMRLDKPIGILLLLWPTLWALWVASDGRPAAWVVAIFVVGTVLMRSAGCVINDYADKDFDGHVERTRNRPLAARRISPKEALGLAAGLSVLSFLLVLPLNGLTIAMSVPAVFLAGSYPYTKRFLAIPQAYLGIAFGFGIPMAFAAFQNDIPLVAWVMLLANVFWAVAYDTEYAMVDRPDDLKIGIKTSAITFGRFEVAAIMICYAMTLLLLGWAGLATGAGAPFLAGLVVAAGLMAYHYTLIRERDRPRCFKAFLHNNWVGAAIFAGWVADYLLR
jgi:4-hydroxybenzoate polyprenyltransferase